MITADQLIAHAVGDYVIQSDWMANEKTKQNTAAFVHALSYTLVFLFLTTSPLALFVIFSTHFIIDRYRLARYVCWLKNFLAPAEIESEEIKDCFGKVTQTNHYPKWHKPWSECSATGYHRDRPPWLAVWLMIIADNVMHVLINGLALYYL